MTSEPRFTLRLFYSYSHKDGRHREKMEQSLTLLRDQEGILDDWSDRQILPGQRISRELQKKIEQTNIFVFLLSTHFLASRECRKEWLQACKIATERPAVFLVPIILSTCPWKDMDGMSDLKALPEDGKPIKSFPDKDVAWQQVYEGLKNLINHLRQNFTLRDDFSLSGHFKTGQRGWPGTVLFYLFGTGLGKPVLVLQLRGPHLRMWP